MGELSASVRAIVESDALAHVVTINADGSPRVTLAGHGPGRTDSKLNDQGDRVIPLSG